jgi:hypothetical protein
MIKKTNNRTKKNSLQFLKILNKPLPLPSEDRFKEQNSISVW